MTSDYPQMLCFVFSLLELANEDVDRTLNAHEVPLNLLPLHIPCPSMHMKCPSIALEMPLKQQAYPARQHELQIHPAGVASSWVGSRKSI